MLLQQEMEVDLIRRTVGGDNMFTVRLCSPAKMIVISIITNHQPKVGDRYTLKLEESEQ